MNCFLDTFNQACEEHVQTQVYDFFAQQAGGAAGRNLEE